MVNLDDFLSHPDKKLIDHINGVLIGVKKRTNSSIAELSAIFHDLGKLNSECRKILPELSVIQDICERLTPFGTVTRYPGSSMKVSSEHLPLVLSWNQKIRDVVRKQFN